MTATILKQLAAPFSPDQVDWRIGSTNKDKTKGMALAYIDSRAVMHRLDEVCGPFWQCDYVPMPNGTHCCRIGIKIGDEWLWRANGAINFPDSDRTDAKEMAAKGSYSDAFKRAAVLWGIGQYLYDLESPWVEIVAKGSSHVFADGVRQRLDRMIAAGQRQPALVDVTSAHPTAPTSTMAGRKIETEGLGRAREWVNAEAIPAVKACKTAEALNVWVDANSKTIAKLKTVLPEEHKALVDRIDVKADSFNAVAAG